MSIVSQNNTDEVTSFDCFQRFFFTLCWETIGKVQRHQKRGSCHFISVGGTNPGKSPCYLRVSMLKSKYCFGKYLEAHRKIIYHYY